MAPCRYGGSDQEGQKEDGDESYDNDWKALAGKYHYGPWPLMGFTRMGVRNGLEGLLAIGMDPWTSARKGSKLPGQGNSSDELAIEKLV